MEFRFFRTNFHSDNNIGLYGFATDKYCLLGFEPDKKTLKKMSEILNVKIHFLQLARTDLLGIFAAGNSNGIIVTKLAEESELEKLKELDLNILVLETKETALGNLILCNDKGCIISEKLGPFKKEISEALGVPVETGMIAELNVVGSAGFATNRGCLCSPNGLENELEKVENTLKVTVDVGTVSAGVPFPKAGIIANTHGVVVSDSCTGPELGRISEVLGEG